MCRLRQAEVDATDMMYSWLDSSQHSHQLTVNLTAAAAAAAVDPRATSLAVTEEPDIGDDGGLSMQCSGHWKAPHHAVFHAAHAVLLVSFLIPNTHRTDVFIHLTLVAGKKQSRQDDTNAQSGPVINYITVQIYTNYEFTKYLINTF